MLAGELQLLRLMQKTGPVWSELQSDVATDLAAEFGSLLSGGAQLQRLLPWLWYVHRTLLAPS